MPTKEQLKKIRYDLLNDKEWLYKKYEDEFLNTVKIAKECNCSKSLVRNQLKKFGIEIRSNSESKNPNARWELLNNKDWMSKKYEDELLSTVKIAEECNCSHTLVGNQLKKFGIEIRSNSKVQNPNAKWDLLNNKEWLCKKYEDEFLSTLKIAEECNCGNVLVGKQLKKFGIEIRSNSESKNPNARWELLNNKEWMSKKYEDEFLNTVKIAEECNCGDVLVGKQLKKFGIEIRSNSESQNPNAKWDLLNNKEWMSKKYEDELLSTLKIAEECNCSYVLVWNQLKKFEIEIRSKNEAKNPNARWDLLNNKDWMSKKYEDELLSTLKIAEECNCDKSLVGDQLKKFEIEIREIKGKNHPNWKGGISFAPYCQKFNESKKEEIRDKFDRVCFLCGKSEEENNNRCLSVHHVDYNKGQGCGHSWNLIPLCSSCHAKTNNNRYFWFNLLNNYWLYCKEIHFLNLDLFIPEG